MTSFREAIYAFLTNSAALNGIVADRIFASHPDGDTDYPYFIFEISRTRGVHGRHYGYNLQGPDGTSIAHIKLMATALRESDAVEAIRAIGTDLEDFSGNLFGVEILHSMLEFEYDAAEKNPDGSGTWLHEIAAIYRITHRATPADS